MGKTVSFLAHPVRQEHRGRRVYKEIQVRSVLREFLGMREKRARIVLYPARLVQLALKE